VIDGAVRALDLDRNNRIMAVANCLWGAGSGIYLPIWPLHLERLGASPIVLGVLLGLGGVIGIVISIPAAALATRLGLKRALLVGWGLAPFGTAIFAIASAWEAVVPGVIALALVGLCGPAYSSYIGVAADGRDLPRTFTLMGASITLGTVLTAPIGGAIADAFGMTPVLIGATVLYFLSFASTWRLDDLRIADASAKSTTVATSASSVPVVGSAWRGFIDLIREPAFVRPVVGLLALVAAGQVGLALAPAWLAGTYGYSQATIGLLGSVEAGASIGMNVILGQVAARRGATFALGVAGVMTVASHAALLGAGPRWLGGAAYLLRGGAGTFHWIGTGAIGAILARLSRRLPGASERGFALYYAAEGAVAAAATMSAGALYGLWTPAPFVLSLGGVAVLSAIVLWRARARRLSGRDTLSLGNLGMAGATGEGSR
jgi:predicted MFS family arabinose efflux permease